MRVPALTLLIVLFIQTAEAQTELADLNLVSFHSEQEKALFTNYIRKGEADNFLLFMASGSLLNDTRVIESKERFYQYISSYKDDKFQNKKNDRKTRQIHDDLHKTFLKKYQNGTGFEEIFYNGNYNSISATALFALAFERLRIPYAIKEDPENVHLLAYPESESIKVEAASPFGITTLDDLYKQNYVKILKDSKIISAKEASGQSTNDLFNKYYYGNQNLISIQNLLGLQYLHEAQLNFDQRNFERSFAQAEKAYLLYPCPKTAYILTVTGTNAFQSRKQQDSTKAIQLAKLSNYTEQGITSDMIVAEFARAIQELLFDKGRRKELDVFYNILGKHVSNHQMKEDIDFLYNYETGRYLNHQAKYNEAMPYFEKAIANKPDKLDAANGLISNLVGKISQSGNNVENLNLIERYSKEFPSLNGNNIFNNMLLSGYLIQIAMEFDMQNFQQGEKYRLTFEELAGRYPDAQPNTQLVGQAYSRAAVYFYRKGQTQKARNLIEAGLKLSPNNYELMTRKRMIN